MVTNKISKDKLANYNSGERICKTVILELFEKMKNKELLDVKKIEDFCNKRILDECELIYDNKNIKFCNLPTSISLNNCVGNYIYSDYEEYKRYNYIQNGDVVKIEIGVNISDCIINLGETIVYNDITSSENKDLEILLYEKHGKYLELLEILKNDLLEDIKTGETNDEIRINIESKCTEYGCFPINNCTSYQHLDGQVRTDESKYIVCNYKQENDSNINIDNNGFYLDNSCFEFEEGEIYTIHLKIIPNDEENNDETKHKYYKLEDSHIYRFNDNYYDLKLKSSREFYSVIKKKYSTTPFNYLEYKNDKKYRLGIKECLKNGILEEYTILYSKDKLPIYHKKFTIIVGKDQSNTFNNL